MRKLFGFDLHMRSFLLSKRVYVCDRPNYPIFVETRSDSEERLHYLVEEDAKNVEVFRTNTTQPFSGKIENNFVNNMNKEDSSSYWPK